MNKIEVSTFTIETNNISDKNREDIVALLEQLMTDYNDVAFEPLCDGELVHVEVMEV